MHDEASWFAKMGECCPYFGESVKPDDRYVPIALLVLDIVRSEIDTQPEAVIACAGMTLCILSCWRPSVAKALWDDGFLDVRSSQSYLICRTSARVDSCHPVQVFQVSLRRYNPMERISKHDMIPNGLLTAFKVTCGPCHS